MGERPYKTSVTLPTSLRDVAATRFLQPSPGQHLASSMQDKYQVIKKAFDRLVTFS